MNNTGTAFAQGIQGFIQGADARQTRNQRQQQYTQQAREMEMKEQSYASSEDFKSQQIQQLTMQNRKMADQMTTQNIWRAFENGGTLAEFNNLVNTDKNLQNLFPGIQSLREIDFGNKEHMAQVKNMGEDSKPVLASYIRNGKLIEKVEDLNFLKIRSGYATFDLKRKNERAQLELNTQSTEIMQQAAIEAEKSPENAESIMMSALLKTQPNLFIGNKLDPNKRRDALRQVNVAMERAGILPDSEVYRQVHANFVNTKLEGTGSTREQSDISQNMSGIEIGNTLLSGDTKNIATIDKNLRVQRELELIQSDGFKVHKKKKEEFDGAVLNVKAFDRLEKTFVKAVNSGDYKSGVIDSFTNWVNSITPESIQKFAGMDTGKIQKVVGLEGNLGMEVARYLKEMSGTAASENEAQRTMKYIIGTWTMQEEGRATSIKEFKSNLKKKAQDQGKALVKVGFVGDTYDKYKELSELSRAEMIEYLKSKGK